MVDTDDDPAATGGASTGVGRRVPLPATTMTTPRRDPPSSPSALLTPRSAAAAAAAARTRDHLLDVESLRGAAHTSTKPAKFTSILWLGAIRILFFPFARDWWLGTGPATGGGGTTATSGSSSTDAGSKQQPQQQPQPQQQQHPPRLSPRAFALGCALYALQGCVSLAVLLLVPPAAHPAARLLRTEASIPIVLWVVAALLYGHLAAASQGDVKRHGFYYAGNAAAALSAAAASGHGGREEGKTSINGPGAASATAAAVAAAGLGSEGARPASPRFGAAAGRNGKGGQKGRGRVHDEDEDEDEDEEESDEDSDGSDDEEEEGEGVGGGGGGGDGGQQRLTSEQEGVGEGGTGEGEGQLEQQQLELQQMRRQDSDDDDEEDYGREEPYSEELQEREEKMASQALARAAAAAAAANQPPQPSSSQHAATAPPTSTNTTFAALGPGPTRAPSPTAASATGAGADFDEDGMLLRGLGMAAAANNGGGATVRVTLFDRRGERFKASMTLSQIRRHIVDRASTTQQDWLYRQAPLFGAALAAFVPRLYQLYQLRWQGGSGTGGHGSTAVCDLHERVGHPAVLWAVRVVSMATVFSLALGMFRQLAVTEYTYKRRYKYSKYFAAITSVTKARRYDIPHFSLKAPQNIKMWLALRAGRAWLRRYEAQRVADTVVSSTFLAVIFLLAVLVVEVFTSKGGDSGLNKEGFLTQLLHWELLVWGGVASFFLLRFFSLGARINEKYHDTSVLLTEQINVQLRIFENCCKNDDKKKREKLQIANSVLSLAKQLLKELDSPNRVSGLSMSPFLYHLTRAVLLSALSAAVSDTFGFKLQLKFLK